MTSQARFAIHRDQRIAYDVTGEGPAVVLQHGLLGSRQWPNRYTSGLAEGRRLIRVDSLGHGESDKPADGTLYALEQRAGDVAAVLDAEGIDRAHFIGYSMGGWLGSGMLQFQPDRLLSVVIGGWDPVGGMMSQPDVGDLDGVIAAAPPQLAAWVTEEAKPALGACFEAVSETRGAREAIVRAPVPVLVWIGRDDPPFQQVRALAAEMPSVELLEVPGDHMEAVFAYGRESMAGLRAFLDRVEAIREEGSTR